MRVVKDQTMVVEREFEIPLRILLLLGSFSSGDIFSGGMGTTCYEMLGNYSEDREEEVPYMNNEEESWEGSCLAKFSEFLGFSQR